MALFFASINAMRLLIHMTFIPFFQKVFMLDSNTFPQKNEFKNNNVFFT